MNRSNAIVGTLIIVAILVAANFLSASRFVRLDLTANKEYTISPSTRRVLAEMDDLVNVKVYFSRGLPSYLATLQRDVRDVLNEYRAYSGGKLLVEFKDPSTDADVEAQCRRLGIPEVQLDVIEKDSRQIQNAFLGLAVLYEDRSEVIPVVSSVDNLEYELTSAIIKVRQTEDQVLGYLQGHGEPDLFSELQQVREILERQYIVRNVDLDGGRKPVPDDINTLVIAGSENVPEREKYLIDQYVMRGGRLLVLEDSIQLVGGALQARTVRSGFENLLPTYGVRVEDNVVLDPVCAQAGFNSGFIRFMVKYPYWPHIIQDTEGFNSENPIVSKLESLVLPWPASMSPSMQKPETVEYIWLCRTSEAAWEETGPFNLNPQQEWTQQEETQRFTLAAAVTGMFKSHYADRDVPAAPVDSTAIDVAPVADTEKLTESVAESQIVVVGTSQVIREQFLAQFPGNLTFFLNTIDWLTLGDDLINIRSRAVSDRPLDPDVLVDEAEGRRNVIKFLGVFGMPLVLGALGVGRWLKRRREKRVFEASLHHIG